MHYRTAQSMIVLLMVCSAAAFAQVPPAELPAGSPTTALGVSAAMPTGAATPTPALPSLSMLGAMKSENAQPASGTKMYSYGTSPISVFFMPVQVDHMKTAIRTYEDSSHDTATKFVAPQPVAEKVETVKIAEPADYPVFYLASIVYNAPGTWSLWVSGHKITSRKNNTDLTVLQVSPDSATFSWSPTYAPAIVQRHTSKQFAPTDPIKNRLLKTQQINLNDKGNAITFTLHPNQSFSAGYFSNFEGYVASPKMPAVAAAPSPAEPESIALTGPSRAPSAAALMNETTRQVPGRMPGNPMGVPPSGPMVAPLGMAPH